jgi:hypothetical protein
VGLANERLITQVDHLLSGRLVIPSIQREYVWQRNQVPFLLDSLYRGYPIGSLLVWNTTMDVPLKRAAVLQDDQVQLRPAVLLDGQQRLTSLAKVVAPDRVTGARLDIRFDIETESFLNASAKDRRRPRLVSVTELLGESPQFGPILDRAGVDRHDPSYDTFYDRIRRVHEIRSYLVAVTTIDSDDYETVAEIFARVNQGGRRLSKGDLVYSAIAARWPDGLDVIDNFNDQLDRQNFALDREAVLRLTGLLAGTGSHSIRLIAKDVSGDDLKRAWADTERALGYAVDFLKGECAIPRSAVLSSPNMVVIPAYLLFQRGNRVSVTEAEGMRRWVYTAMAFSYYSNTVEGKLDFDARLVRERGGTELIDELIRRASGPRPAGAAIEPADLASKKSSSSWFNLLYIAALRNSAKDWLSNRMLADMPMTSDSKIEYHHVFPRAKVAKRYGSELTNSIANLAFVSGDSNRKIGARDPSAYLPEIPLDRLHEQWLPTDKQDWDLDRFASFLAHRRALLAEVLNEMLGLRRFAGAAHSVDTEVPQDDDEVTLETSAREPRRRDVAKHILECFEGLEGGAELTVGEIVSAPSSQYDAGEISPGAVRARLEAGTVPGVEAVAGRSPMTARLVGRSEPRGPEPRASVQPATRTSQPRVDHAPVERRSVGQHIIEVFEDLPAGTVLTVSEIAARRSSQYHAGEISQGAIAALLDRGNPLPGLAELRGSSPRAVRKAYTRVQSVPARVAADGHGAPAADLGREFHREMLNLYRRSQREVDYNPTLFVRMISEHGGVEAARRLVTSATPSDGFTKLWESGRLDLTAEALVVQPRFSELFDETTIERARQRLADYGSTA